MIDGIRTGGIIMRRIIGLSIAFSVAAGAIFALGGCGGESTSANTAPNDKQSSKEKMKDPATGQTGSK